MVQWIMVKIAHNAPCSFHSGGYGFYPIAASEILDHIQNGGNPWFPLTRLSSNKFHAWSKGDRYRILLNARWKEGCDSDIPGFRKIVAPSVYLSLIYGYANFSSNRAYYG